MDEKKTFKALNHDGEEIEYTLLFEFENTRTGKSYVTYTDNSNTRIYAGTVTYEGDRSIISPIESEEEWRYVEDYVERAQTGVGITMMVDESQLSPMLRRLLYGDDE